MPHPYRPCVGLYILNSDNKIFVGERIDNPGAWQMPQGGIDPEEDIEAAVFREMKEEIGTNNAEILSIMEEKLRYDLPENLKNKLWDGKYQGQEQTWVALKFLGQDSDINLNYDSRPEFQAWQWVDPEQSLDLIVPFKRETYQEVIAKFRTKTF